MLNRPALILLLVAVAASSASARQTIRTQDVDSDSPFANVFLQMHSSVRAASLDRAFTAVKDCDVPSDKTSAPCCSGIQCPFKGGMCCPGTKTCCPGGTSCMEAIEGVPQQCQSLAFLGEAADTLDAKVKYLKAASAEKARRTQIILDQVALMTTGGLNQAPPVPQPRCTGAQPCLAADLLAPNSFPASQLTNADGSSLSAAQAAALQAQQPQAPVDPNPYVPRQPSPEQKDMSCVCPPVAPCGSNYCAPPPKCACDLFWSSHLQHQGRIALDDQEPGDENYNTSPQNSTSSEDLANAIARAAAEAEEKAEAERQAQLQAAEQDAELLKKLFDENDNSSMSAAHSLAVQEAKHVSESIKILDDITAMDVPELAPALNLTKGPPLKTVDNTMSFMDPNNDPLVLKAQNRGGENVANRAIDDVDDRRDDGPPQAGDDDVFERSDTVSKELQRDASSSARHQQTNIVVNLQMSRNGTGGGYFSHRPKIPANEPEESSSEPEAKDAAEAREEKFSKKEEKKQEMLARKLLNRRKLETRTEYCVSRSPAAKGPLRTLMFSNDPTCGAEHAPAFEQYARFYAFPFPVAGSAAYCVATTRDSMWRMQVVVDDTSCVTKSWNQEFVFYAYPTYHPGTAPFCIKESTNGNSVKRQYIDPGRTACSSEYWKQIGVFYAFQTPGDPSAVPSPADLKADDENSEETSEESTEPKVTAGAGAGSQVTPVRFASAPPMPPSAQPRFVQRTQRMPVAPPTPGSYDAPKLSLREKAARDEKNWKDLMNNMGPRATNQQPLAPWANRR